MSDRKGRYVIGIDLGTTNCSLAYRDMAAENPHTQLFAILQWDGESRVFADIKLPSFTWILPKAIQRSGARRFAWHAGDETVRLVVGREAKAEALKEDARVVHSAKSWLSVGAASTRQSAFLPWATAAVAADEKLSPVAVQTAYLSHLKNCWDQSFAVGSDPQYFVDQIIVVTVPASFDELAQRLTLEAAQVSGYPSDMYLLEEPLAAFYDFLQTAQEDFARYKRILVCDIGGGTCDFTLLDINSQSVPPVITRVKVSEHILLGGDNIDLALTKLLADRCQTGELPRGAWQVLLAQTRQLKESILSSEGTVSEEFFVSIPLEEGKLLGRYASASITRGEFMAAILEGFFPAVSSDQKPVRSSRSGLRSWGLPYAEDTAFTRHLAAFLGGQSIDAVLCAGGSLLPMPLQQHLVAVLQNLQTEPLKHLQQAAPDLAVARGAACYAAIKSQGLAEVASPSSHSLYVTLEAVRGQSLYLCLIPRGWPREKPVLLQMPGLRLRVGQPVSFQLYAANDASGDSPGGTRDFDPSWRPLPLLSSRLQRSKNSVAEIPVSLKAFIRETGMLELSCQAEDGSGSVWSLDFSLNPVMQSQVHSRVELPGQSRERIAAAVLSVRNSFGKSASRIGLGLLMRPLEDILGAREQWTIPTLRQLWQPLAEAMFRRQKDEDTEAAWLYLAGYTLRPGFGSSRDNERITQLWQIFAQGFTKITEDKQLASQWWLMWRRVAGGLNSEQQNRLLDKILPSLRSKSMDTGPELIRLAACLERADMSRKIQVGRALLQAIVSGQKDQLDARIWSLARVAGRNPLYAGPEALLPIGIIEDWAQQLNQVPIEQKAYQKLSLFYAWAGRRRGDVLTDLNKEWRLHFVEKLRIAGVSEQLIRPVLEPVAQSDEFLHNSKNETFSRTARYSAIYRPACRISQTGVTSVGCFKQAFMKELSWYGFIGVLDES